MALELTGAHKRELRAAAHALKPVVHIGKNGAEAAVLEEIDKALRDHELIKVRFVAAPERRKEVAAEIAQKLDCAVAGTVGHIAILYRPSDVA